MIFLLAFLMNVTTGMMIFSNPLLALRLEADVFKLGALGTVGAGTYAICCAAIGPLVDRVGRKKMLLAGCLFLALFYAGMFFITRLWQLFLFAALCSVAGACFWPAMMKWVGEEEGRTRLHSRVGGFNVAWSAGIMLGPVIAGKIYSAGYRYPYLVAAGVVAVILSLVLAGRRPSRKPAREVLPARETESPPASPRVFMYLGWLGQFATWFSISSSESLFPKLALTLGIKPQPLSAMIALVGAGQCLLFVVLSRTHRWHYRLPLFFSFQFLGMAALVIFALGRWNPLFGLAFLLLGLCGGMVYFSSLFYSLFGQDRKGTKSGFHEAIMALGVACGPLSGGALAKATNLRAPYLLGIGVFILSIGVQVFLVRRLKKIA